MLLKFYNFFADKVRHFSLIKKYPRVKELIKYSLVGNFSNLVDFSFYIFLTRFFIIFYRHYLWTSIFSMIIASIIRFILHKYWTFKDITSNIYLQYLKLIIVLGLSLIIENTILFISVERFSFNDIIGKFIGLVLSSLITYFLTKKWVFYHQSRK